MLLFCLALMLTTPSSNIYSATLACEDGTVFVEDSRVDVLMICGEPDWKDSHQEEVVERLDSSTKQKLFITVEEWTYNFGPSQFMTIVTLKNGKVADIQYGNYGYGKSPKPEQREFSDRIVSIGDSQSDVIVKWGEPMWKNSRQEELREKLEDGRDRSVFVTIEEWTYNLGPNRFMRMLTFKNGRVTDIKTGSYGYEMN
jgi:hypothetical protein